MFLLTIHRNNRDIRFALIYRSELTLQAIFTEEKLNSVLLTFSLVKSSVTYGSSFLDKLGERDREYIKLIQIDKHSSGYILTVVFESTKELYLDLAAKVIHLNEQIAIDLTEMLLIIFTSDFDDQLTFRVSASDLIQNSSKLNITRVNH